MLWIEQLLNGLQYSLMLFLFAAGLTLVFGIMNLVNLAHGSLYMLGAYSAATLTAFSGSYAIGLLGALLFMGLFGAVLEIVLIGRLYRQDHLTQVLATFALILISNESVRILWGVQPLPYEMPAALSGSVPVVGDLRYSAYRLATIVAGVAVALLLYWMVARTRVGMWVRAGASNREMVQMMGVNVRRLFTAIFALGAALSGLAGAALAPLMSVQVGMGEEVLILAFVVVVVGGVGSIRGAFIAALLVGMVDSMGRAWLPALLGKVLPAQIASDLGPALASMSVYLLMAVVLMVRPQGLFFPGAPSLLPKWLRRRPPVLPNATQARASA
jgi:branched-chain amino acid transport system permease protein